MPAFTKFQAAKNWIEQNSILHLDEIPDNFVEKFYNDLFEDESLLQQLQSNRPALTARRSAIREQVSSGIDMKGKNPANKEGAGDGRDSDSSSEPVREQGGPLMSTTTS
jgi:hypothetical protein